jgi:tetratricopeptide (TPR) repeat protein
MQDEVKRGQYEESLVLFDRMLAKRPQDAQALYARGEVYRLRSGPDDIPKALADLNETIRLTDAPVQAHRSLGLLHKQRADASAATIAFEKYLSVAPDAPDATLIKTYLSGLVL